MTWTARLWREGRRIVLTALIGGLLGATLVRLGPGFGVDERELDPRLNEQSRAALAAGGKADGNIAAFYARYLSGLARGDFGYSVALNQPVAELLKQRLPVTLESLGYGLAGGGLAGFALALASVGSRLWAADAALSMLAGLGLSLPAAAIALFFLWMGTAGRWAIAIAVFPHVFRYSKNVVGPAAQAQHVLAARSRGLSGMRILLAHVLAPAAPQLAALAGIAVTIAFGASIPIEAICDTAGVGQLAWKAALARDLPLLVAITMLVSVMTVTANSLADLALGARRSP